MYRRIIVAAVATALAIVPSVKGSLVGTVLYPIVPPAGFSGFAYGQSATYLDTNVAGQTVGAAAISGGGNHALLFSGPSGSAIDLNPTSGFSTSLAYGTFLNQQVGNGSGTGTGSNPHALLWSGSPGSAVDLNPTNIIGISKSYAYGTNGTQQVGYGTGGATGNLPNALLWSGTANSAVNLNPTNLSGFSRSYAYATDGPKQVGYGYGTGTGNHAHALLWASSANTTVDLSPAGMTLSYAYGISGNQQVGYGTGSGGNAHALLWTGSAGSAVDLNPTNLSGITTSYAYDTNGTQQVGYGNGVATAEHALLWSGLANSAVDLQALLPATGSWSNSHSASIDGSGNVYGIASGTYNGVTGNFAVEWSAGSTGVTVLAGQVYHFPVATGTGVSSIVIGGLTVNATGTAIVDPAVNHANRQLLVVSGTGMMLSGTVGNWTAQLDLGNNDLDLPGGSLATVTDQVRQGFNAVGGLNWNGAGGITSASAGADPKHLTALGVIQNNQGGTPFYGAGNLFDGRAPAVDDVLAKYTYFGDANLDGAVDGSDYTLIDNGFNSRTTGTPLTGWYNGDFNYDGVIDGSDYTLIDNAFNNQGGNLNATAFVLAANSTAQIAGSVSVPEPMCMSLVGTVAILLHRRRSTTLL